jgi:hypothetical protein
MGLKIGGRMMVGRACDGLSLIGKRQFLQWRMGIMAIVAVSSVAISTLPSQSFPKDPKRPNTSKTCTEALQRVKEAGLGSPLISAEENRKVFLEALAVAERLCGDC